MTPVVATTSMWSLVSNAISTSSPLEQSVLYLLVIFSIVSWALILMKWRALAVAKQNSLAFLAVFETSNDPKAITANTTNLGPSPIASIYKVGMETWESGGGKDGFVGNEALDEKLQIRMQHTAKEMFTQLRWGLGFLASVSSASPFIGLFGTVWGIMATFQNLGDAKSASLAVVAPGISAALIATAAGLAVAIPAVMAYNWLLGRVEELQEKSDIFIERVSFLLRRGASSSGPVARVPDVLQDHHTPVAMAAVSVPSDLTAAGTSKVQ